MCTKTYRCLKDCDEKFNQIFVFKKVDLTDFHSIVLSEFLNKAYKGIEEVFDEEPHAVFVVQQFC